MEWKFQKEEHNRLDKAKKADYLEKLREGQATNSSWSGIDADSLRRKTELREAELRRASQLYFVYGKWLFQNTKSQSHFAHLNSKHVLPDSDELEAAFRECREKWLADHDKIVKAIKEAPIVKPRGLPRWFPKFWIVHWLLPFDVIADEVWRKIPPAFRFEPKSKGAMESAKEQSISDGKERPN